MDGGLAPVNDSYMRKIFVPFSKAARSFHSPIDATWKWITPEIFHDIFVDANVQIYKSAVANV